MSKKPIIHSLMDPIGSEKIKEKDVNFITFMDKKIIVRIFYPSSEIHEYKSKVTSHSFTIDNKEYFIHSDAFYRKGKLWYCDYYYNNPRPIIHKDNFRGILVASSKLKQLLESGEIKDANKVPITYEDWKDLPYEQKMLFPYVAEFDGHMINKLVNCNFFEGLWNTGGSLLSKKSWGIIIFIIIIGFVAAMIFYFKLRGGAA